MSYSGGMAFTALEGRLYSRDVDFNKFNYITSEDIRLIDSDIKSRFPEDLTGLARYNDVLVYLTNPFIYHTYPNVDLRLLYLIRAVDPNLIFLNEFYNTNIPSLDDISKAFDEERENLAMLRKSRSLSFKQKVREQIGFYNSKVLGYEQAYFNRFLKDKEFIRKANMGYFTKLMELVPKKVLFKFIDSDTERLLSDKVAWYLEQTGGCVDAYTVSFHLLCQNSMLGLKTRKEQMAFFITVVDPELKLLRIYEEESRIQEVKRRAIEELGFYDDKMIEIEKAYKKRFMPDVKLSVWSI